MNGNDQLYNSIHWREASIEIKEMKRIVIEIINKEVFFRERLSRLSSVIEGHSFGWANRGVWPPSCHISENHSRNTQGSTCPGTLACANRHYITNYEEEQLVPPLAFDVTSCEICLFSENSLSVKFQVIIFFWSNDHFLCFFKINLQMAVAVIFLVILGLVNLSSAAGENAR